MVKHVNLNMAEEVGHIRGRVHALETLVGTLFETSTSPHQRVDLANNFLMQADSVEKIFSKVIYTKKEREGFEFSLRKIGKNILEDAESS